MPHNHHETILSNIMLAVGAATAGTAHLVSLDLYLGIAVKMVSFCSLLIVIALNLPKLLKKIEEWRK